MKKALFWIGAGDLAQRSLPYLTPYGWKTFGLNRRGNALGFDKTYGADVIKAENLALLSTATHIIYSPTPGGRTAENYAAIYDQGIKNVIKNINQGKLQHFIFISSTAVYGSAPTPQDEQSPFHPPAFNGEALIKAEKLLRAELGNKLTVIRFTGLYGPGRNYLFNRLREGNVTVNPAIDNYANRIHIEDAARVCAHVLHLEQTADSYLGTDSTPLPLSHLYTEVAQWLKTPDPLLDQNLPYDSKHFSNQRLINSGFHFLYPSTLAGYQSLFI